MVQLAESPRLATVNGANEIGFEFARAGTTRGIGRGGGGASHSGGNKKVLRRYGRGGGKYSRLSDAQRPVVRIRRDMCI